MPVVTNHPEFDFQADKSMFIGPGYEPSIFRAFRAPNIRRGCVFRRAPCNKDARTAVVIMATLQREIIHAGRILNLRLAAGIGWTVSVGLISPKHAYELFYYVEQGDPIFN